MTDDEPKKRGRPPKPATVEIVVLWKQGIQMDDETGYVPFRWRGVVSQELFEEICALDDKAGRDHRLMSI